MQLAPKQNVGDIDRIIRVTLGVLIVGFGYFNLLPFNFWVSTFIIIFGFSQIIEGLIGY